MESFDEMRILDIRPAHVTDRAEWFRSPGCHSGLSGELKAKWRVNVTVMRRCSTIMFYSSKQRTFSRLGQPLDDGATSLIDLE
jgi:hypothetical protein